MGLRVARVAVVLAEGVGPQASLARPTRGVVSVPDLEGETEGERDLEGE